MEAQTNAPNPNLDEAQFRALYVDFDPSHFRPPKATTADWTRVAGWREAMDAAVARPR
jgi:hypothetical protein